MYGRVDVWWERGAGQSATHFDLTWLGVSQAGYWSNQNRHSTMRVAFEDLTDFSEADPSETTADSPRQLSGATGKFEYQQKLRKYAVTK